MSDSTTRRPPVLVLGSTGKTGRRIVQRLRHLGVPVRGGSRRAHPRFDWNARDTWERVLEGVSAAFICHAPDLAMPGAADDIGAFVERARAHGVHRLVLLSGRGEEEARRCEALVQRSGLEWSVVRSSWFAQNFSEGPFADLVRGGTIALPAGEVGEPFVDLDDVADVAVQALTGEGHGGRIHEVTGPRLLTFAEAAEEIGRALGRPVRHARISAEAFAAGLAAAGEPEDMQWLLGYLFSTVLDGRNASVADGVSRALGRSPADFSDYARRSAAAGAWSLAS